MPELEPGAYAEVHAPLGREGVVRSDDRLDRRVGGAEGWVTDALPYTSGPIDEAARGSVASRSRRRRRSRRRASAVPMGSSSVRKSIPARSAQVDLLVRPGELQARHEARLAVPRVLRSRPGRRDRLEAERARHALAVAAEDADVGRERRVSERGLVGAVNDVPLEAAAVPCVVQGDRHVEGETQPIEDDERPARVDEELVLHDRRAVRCRRRS